MRSNDAGRAERPRWGQDPKPYLVVLRGELGERFAAEFDGVTLESWGGKTFLRGAVDQAQLHGILERAQNYNLEIIEVGEVPADPVEDVTRGKKEPHE